MLKIGVIGYGLSAKVFHLPFIAASTQFELTAISTSQTAAVKVQYPAIDIFATAQELISTAKVDVIVVTAPNSVHYALTKLCLQQGIHVILEKPMTSTSAEAAELIELAKAQSLILSVYHNRRWDGDFLTLKKLLADQSLGDVRYFESRFDRFRPKPRPRWREMAGVGSGIWFDLGSHLVDQAICLFGLPHSLTARCLLTRDNSQAIDYFHVQLHYTGLEVVLHGSPFSASPNTRFRMEGTLGSYLKYGLDPQEDQLKAGLLPTDVGYGIEDSDLAGTLYTENSQTKVNPAVGCYQHYYTALADAINQGSPIPVSGEDAMTVIKILELAERSSREGTTLSLT